MLLSACQVCASSFYDIDSRAEIASEIKSESSGLVRFGVESSIGPGGIKMIDFFGTDNRQKIGSLIFSPDGSVNWQGAGDLARSFQADGLFIIPGLSIPVDVLPVKKVFNAEEGFLFYEFQKKAGDRSFLERIEIFSLPVSRSEAMENGWLRYYENQSDNFFLICAKKQETNELVVQQLWEPGGGWWIYEETMFRRSWRLP